MILIFRFNQCSALCNFRLVNGIHYKLYYKGKYAGTLTHIGGYSLNCHKHIHTGEGGVVVTHDEDYAERIRLIRNHAEEVVEGMKQQNLINMIGHNYRMGEIEAAIGIEQLKKLIRMERIYL